MKRKKYMNKFKGIFSKQGKFALCPNERQVSLQAKHRFEAHHMIAAQFQAFQSYFSFVKWSHKTSLFCQKPHITANRKKEEVKLETEFPQNI